MITSFELDSETVSIRHRPAPSPDLTVLKEVFSDHSYGFGEFVQGQALAKFYHAQSEGGKVGFLCDAGANIGAASLYFRRWFPNIFVFAIEPDEENISILNANIGSLPRQEIFCGALTNSSEGGFLTKIDHWSHRVGSAAAGLPVRTMSATDVLERALAMNAFPFIFKIDIEGSEDTVFSGDAAWVDSFPLVAIEFHDWMLPFSGSSRNALKAFCKYEFEVILKGQLVFFFNTRLLSRFV